MRRLCGTASVVLRAETDKIGADDAGLGDISHRRRSHLLHGHREFAAQNLEHTLDAFIAEIGDPEPDPFVLTDKGWCWLHSPAGC